MTQRDSYETLVISEAMGDELTPEQTAELHDRPRLWFETIGVLIQDLGSQLAKVDRHSEGYEDWRGRLLSIKRKLERRRPAVKQMIADAEQAQRDARRLEHSYALRGAVMAHRAAVLDGGYDPEAHDLALWAAAGLESR